MIWIRTTAGHCVLRSNGTATLCLLRASGSDFTTEHPIDACRACLCELEAGTPGAAVEEWDIAMPTPTRDLRRRA